MELGRDWKLARPVIFELDVTEPWMLFCEIRQPVPAFARPEIPDGLQLPRELEEFWQVCGGATLFKDAKHGQRGLDMFSPANAIEATREFHENDFRAARGDLVIGNMIATSEHLLVRADPAGKDFGRIVVSDEIDGRHYWFIAAQNLRNFLEQYAKRTGREFWRDDPVYLGGR